MKLSVIIVSYNSGDVLCDCLTSIDKYNDLGEELEVIIVDNYEKEGLEGTLNYDVSYRLKYIRNESNIGFGAGNNVGVLNAKGECVFFLNPDTILVEPIFKDIVAQIEKDSNTIYGFRLIDKYGADNNSYSFFYDSYLKYRFFSLLKIINNNWLLKNDFAKKNIWPWGAAFAMNKDSFINAGKFDNQIFLCNEEADLLHRIPNRNVYMSPHRIIHLEGHGTTVSSFRYYQFLVSLSYYMDKYSISKASRFLWNIHMWMTVFLKRIFNKDENSLNFIDAYQKKGGKI